MYNGLGLAPDLVRHLKIVLLLGARGVPLVGTDHDAFLGSLLDRKDYPKGHATTHRHLHMAHGRREHTIGQGLPPGHKLFALDFLVAEGHGPGRQGSGGRERKAVPLGDAHFVDQG
jgi:hypothetical protein